MRIFPKILIIVLIASSVFALLPLILRAQVKIPENFTEAKGRGIRVIEELPKAIKNIWQENVLPVWRKMADWFQVNIWSKIWKWGGKEAQTKTEIGRRKTIISEEWRKEKEELGQDLERFKNTILEKLKIKEFKDFIKQ